MKNEHFLRLLVFVALMVLIIMSVVRDYNESSKTPHERQLEKFVTVQFANESLITLKGYAILDGIKSFQKDDSVYVELTDNYLPSSVRHPSDVYSEKGQAYAITQGYRCCPALLIKGKIIALKQ